MTTRRPLAELPRALLLFGLAAGLAAALLSGCGGSGVDAAGTPVGTSGVDNGRPTGSKDTSTGGVATGGSDASQLSALIDAAHLPSCPTLPVGIRESTTGLPGVTLPCLGAGPAVRLSALAGSPSVVNVWASWCAPCRAEIPILSSVAESAGGAVRFLGVAVNDTRPAALSAAADFGLRFPSVLDVNASIRPVSGIGVPATIFLRADGTVAFVERGPISSPAQLRSLLAEYLGVTLRSGG